MTIEASPTPDEAGEAARYEAARQEAGPSEPYRRFDRYTMLSLYGIAPLAPFVAALLLADASRWSWATGAYLLTLTAATVPCVFMLRAAVRRAFEGTRWPRALVGVFVTLSLTAAALGAFAAPPNAGGAGIDLPTACVLIALLTLGIGFAPAMSWRAVVLVAIAISVSTTLAWVLLHGRVDPNVLANGRWFPTLFSTTFIALGLLWSATMATWMLRQMREQAELTVVRSELAVAQERLRFSRDLHDVFGRTLTAVAVKADLAAELSGLGHAAQATAQMREVQQLADDALREVRGVVAGYRAVDLEAELKGARAMLTAAGIEARIIGDGTGIGAPVAEALAWVVREGVTNVVRHSDASRCTVSLVSGPLVSGSLVSGEQIVEVKIVNDGLRAAQPQPGGTGLAGLRDRLAPLGGTLTATGDGLLFTLSARVPWEAP